ncbi:MAG: ankyrin repeat domain-containing protein [Planctomycetaceae bacterium]|jgi:ankyrin repeat protein|nr:ankyrin repeat domain-containing protein [Planctomycetaceae bacterium]
MSDNIYLELELFLDPAVTDVAALKEELDKKISAWNKLFNADAKYKHFVQVAKAWQRSSEDYDLVQLAREARSIREKHGHDAVAIYEENGFLGQQEYDDLHKEFAPFFNKSTIDSWLHLKVTDSLVPQEPQYPPEVKKKIISKNDMDKIASELKIVVGDDKVSLYDLIGVSPKSDLSTVQENSNAAYNTAFKKPKTGSDSAKVDTELRLLGRAKTIFGDDVSRQGYDIAVKRRPFDRLIDTKLKRRAAKGGITYDDYKRSIDDALQTGYSKAEAEWYVYEYFCKTRKFALPIPTEQSAHTKSDHHQQDKKTESTQQSTSPHSSTVNKSKPTSIFGAIEQFAASVIRKKPTSIFDAIEQDDPKLVEEWINSNPKSVHEKDTKGHTLLHWATKNSHNADIIRYLLKKGAFLYINTKVENGSTPLHWAAFYNPNVDIIQCLIENGASVNVKSNGGSTPLHLAAKNNPNVGIIQCLIKNGASVNVKSNDGYTPLHLAAKNNPNVDIIKCLLANGADINAKNIHDNTPHILAVCNNPNIDVIKCLLRNGASIYVKAEEGFTLLHWAAQNSHNVDTITRLLEVGASIDAKTNEGDTPLHWAAFYNPNVDIIKCLLQKGASVDAKNKLGYTPVDVANTKEKKQILRDHVVVGNGCLSLLMAAVFVPVLLFVLVLVFARVQ